MDTQASPWAVYPGDVGLRIKEGPTCVGRMVWSQYTDAEHRIRITDRDGRDVFTHRGNTQFEPISIEFPMTPFMWDLFVTQFDSGVLQIYVR